MGEKGESFYPQFLQPLLENVDRRSCIDGSRELILILHNPHRKSCPFPPAVARSLEYLVGVPSKAETSGGGGRKTISDQHPRDV